MMRLFRFASASRRLLQPKCYVQEEQGGFTLLRGEVAPAFPLTHVMSQRLCVPMVSYSSQAPNVRIAHDASQFQYGEVARASACA
eukprot:583855-Amphidinium_carterae.1